ncbi:hypothetical protein LBMAG46_33870 [Planctomycetia bacterium]|nr:hypothetical protein LBMAG46_33870 [Planctomycetia bacterium]
MSGRRAPSAATAALEVVVLATVVLATVVLATVVLATVVLETAVLATVALVTAALVTVVLATVVLATAALATVVLVTVVLARVVLILVVLPVVVRVLAIADLDLGLDLVAAGQRGRVSWGRVSVVRGFRGRERLAAVQEDLIGVCLVPCSVVLAARRFVGIGVVIG